MRIGRRREEPRTEAEALHKGVLFGLGAQLVLAFVVLIQKLLLRLGQPLCELVAITVQKLCQLLVFSVTAVALLPRSDVAVSEFFEDVVHTCFLLGLDGYIIALIFSTVNSFALFFETSPFSTRKEYLF